MAMPPVAMAPGHLPELAWWPRDWGPSLCAPTLERPLWAGHSWCRGPAGQVWVILLGRAWGRSVWTGACGPVRWLGGAWTSQPLVTDRGQGGGLGSGAPGARRKGPGSTPLPWSPPAPPDLAWGCRAGWVQGWPSLCACWSGGGQVHLTPWRPGVAASAVRAPGRGRACRPPGQGHWPRLGPAACAIRRAGRALLCRPPWARGWQGESAGWAVGDAPGGVSALGVEGAPGVPL